MGMGKIEQMIDKIMIGDLKTTVNQKPDGFSDADFVNGFHLFLIIY